MDPTIECCPNEILLEVFALVLDDDTVPVTRHYEDDDDWIPTIPQVLTLSQTCRRWRDLVLAEPRLWTRYSLETDPKGQLSPHAIERFHKCFAAAGFSHPLHLAITTAPTAYLIGVDLFSITCQYFSRLRSLSLSLPQPCFSQFVVEQHCFRQLEELTVTVLDAAGSPHRLKSVQLPNLRESRRLRRVSISVEPIDFIPTYLMDFRRLILPFDVLVVLNIKGIDFSDRLILHKILQCATNLERASLEVPYQIMGSDYLPLVVHSSLRDLSLHFPIFFNAHRVLPSLTFPALQNLTLIHGYPSLPRPPHDSEDDGWFSLGEEVVQVLLDLKARSGYTLRSLHLEGISLVSKTQLSEIVYAENDTLLELTIHRCAKVDTSWLTELRVNSSDAILLFPRLNKLVFSGYRVLGTDEILPLLKSRGWATAEDVQPVAESINLTDVGETTQTIVQPAILREFVFQFHGRKPADSTLSELSRLQERGLRVDVVSYIRISKGIAWAKTLL